MGEEQSTEVTTQDTTGAEPWTEVLGHIPSQFHDDVTPALKTWVSEHENKIRGEYAAWQPFVEQKVDPNQLQNAWQLAAALEQNPVQTINNIRAFYEQNGIKFDQQGQPQQQLPQQQSQQPSVDENDPMAKFASEIAELRKQNELMAQVLVKGNDEARAKQEDARVAQEFDNLHTTMKAKYGRDFNEHFVGGLALATGCTLAQAAEKYYEEINSTATAMQRPAPSVLGSGGGLPTSRPDVTKMGSQEFENYATDYVRAMKARGGP